LLSTEPSSYQETLNSKNSNEWKNAI